MKIEKKTCLADDLEGVLKDQIRMFRKSDYTQVEKFATKAGLIINQITETKEFEQPHFDTRRQDIIKLYKTMELMIEAAKDSVGKQLQQVETGKKIINKYRNNI